MHTCLSVGLSVSVVTNSGLMDVPVRYIPTAGKHVRYLDGKSISEQSSTIFVVIFFSVSKLTPINNDQAHQFNITCSFFMLA